MNQRENELLHFNQSEFEKMELNIKNLVKSNNLSVKFALNYFLELCVENGSDGPEYCWYLVKANGICVLLELLVKFKGKQEVC